MLIEILRNRDAYTPTQVILLVIIMLFALTVSFSFHEFMHAFVADRLGDDTPRRMGRVTMNPMAHLDPMGTVLLLLVGFGWGKPVMYNPSRLNKFKSRKAMNIMVSLAGVFGNFIVGLIAMIIISVIMLATGFATTSPVSDCIYYIAAGMQGGFGVPFYASVFVMLFYYTFMFSLSLFAFNLLPIPPLDGFRVLQNLLPLKVTYSDGFKKFTHYGPMVLLALIVIGDFGGFNILGTVMTVLETPLILIINIVAGLIGLLG